MTESDVTRARIITVQLLPATGHVAEDDIAAAVDKAAVLVALDPPERTQLIRDLQAAYTVSVGRAGALDGEGDHKEWLSTRRSDIQWKLWERYMRYLQEAKGFPPPVVSRMDDVTDQILQRLESPQRRGSWDRRGMVVGHVQSGKTANYTGLICKAADAGYKVVVVLAGMDDSLRSQTQLRLDEGLLGFDTQQRRNYDQENSRIGVGRLAGASLYPVNSLTSSAQKGDFKRSTAKQIGVNPGGNDPLLLVVKKNKSILNNLISWITSFDAHILEGSSRPVVHNVPLLVIDDECDHASVNTKVDDPDLSPTAINQCIRDLLASFEQTAYVGYTATPFANIFISPESAASEQFGEEIFPRDFIISLKKPSDYIGASRVFGLEGDSEMGLEEIAALPITRTVTDQDDWVPATHKNGHVVPEPIPGSLQEALLSFVLVCAGRRARDQETEHNSMLVHVTRFTNVQQQVHDQIEEELGLIRQRIRYGDGSRRPTILEQLRRMWDGDFKSTTNAFPDLDITHTPWEELVEHLEPAVSKIDVRTVNGLSVEALEYFNKPEGISVIAVGGAKLSRGLTLEGLSVSYYLRTSRMYDTLLQMGRWFGFRPGYMDLCRLYTTDELQRWYKDTTLANEDLLVQFEEMALTGGTPNDFGLRVRQSAEGLVVTAAGKMRNGTRVKLSFSGAISETIIFDPTEAAVRANEQAVTDLVGRLDNQVSPRPVGRKDPRTLTWSDIDGDLVADFLDEFRTHPQASKAQSSVMAKYIRARIRDVAPELTSWTVALLSNPGTPVTIAGHPIGRTKRAAFPTDKPSKHIFAIRRLLSPVDETLDLTPEELASARARTQDWWEQGVIRGDKRPGPNDANGRAIRLARPPGRGLLLIYALDEAEAEGAREGLPILGFAVSFPVSSGAGAGAIEYVVNNVYSQLELDLE